MKHAIHLFSICILAALPAFATVYNAADNFSNTNPSGPWGYGYASSGAIGTLGTSFTAMPTFSANCGLGVGFQADCWGGVSSSIVRPNATFDSGTVSYTLGYLNLHPGANLDLSILAFTAPVAANYSFVGEFADRDVLGGNGVQVSAVLGNGSFLLNTTNMAAQAAGSPVAINFNRSLAANETVYFVLGASGEYSYDSIGLKLAVDDQLSGVPEPSSILLTGMGAAALAFVRRRR
ncbi:MAG TPA: PEP-CTERM sorting domain-containing protein [Bryobacteraceae bacterium]|nr:PEP-CTERM sorting domain-containing protein [Bryobacteraceae bacterium]